jgi:hypothetical protein
MNWATALKVVVIATWSVVTAQGLGQCNNINAPETVTWVNTFIASVLGADISCQGGAPDRDAFAVDSACNIFVGRVMARMYGLDNFSQGERFLQANEIAALLPTWNDWVDLGSAGNQDVLNAATAAANDGALVIAVWPNPAPAGDGHVALIGQVLGEVSKRP